MAKSNKTGSVKNEIKGGGKIKGRIRTLVIAGLLIVAMFAMAPTATAEHDLKITDHNLHALRYWGSWTPYSYGELLRWEGYPAALDVNCQKLKWVGNIRATSVDDNQCNGWYYGECVSFAKALSKSDVVTGDWEKGSKVMSYNLIQPGTVIATFNSNGDYSPGHTAIFRGYTYSNGQRSGILVWDQNYLPSHYGVVARHSIGSKGTTYLTDPNNANNYYVVRVP